MRGRRYSPERFQRALHSFQHYLEGNRGLAGARRHGEQHAPVAFQGTLNRTVDCNLLIVPLPFSNRMVEWGQQALGLRLVTDTFGLPISRPQFSGGRIARNAPLQTRRIIDFDDLVSVRRIGKLQTEHLGVGLRLLYPIGCRLVVGFGLDHRQREVPCVAEQEVDSLGGFPNKALSYRNDPSICDCSLFGNGVQIGVPADG
jgi:hypothetical protein